MFSNRASTARPAPKVPAIDGETLVPAVPGLVINERFLVEEMVILFVIQLLYRYPVSHGSLVGLAMCRCATDRQPPDSIPRLAMPT